MNKIEQVLGTATRMARLFGVPTAVHPGPTAGHVTLCWPKNDGGLISCEFDVEMPAGEAVGILRKELGLDTPKAPIEWKCWEEYAPFLRDASVKTSFIGIEEKLVEGEEIYAPTFHGWVKGKVKAIDTKNPYVEVGENFIACMVEDTHHGFDGSERKVWVCSMLINRSALKKAFGVEGT